MTEHTGMAQFVFFCQSKRILA